MLLPPSRAGLICTKAVLQARHVWNQSFNRTMLLPWMGLAKIGLRMGDILHQFAVKAALCQVLSQCGCKTNYLGNCKCYRPGLQCIAECTYICEDT